MKGAPVLLLACALAAPGVLAQEGANILPNGDFEEARGDRPAHWQRPDGLTSFWEADPLRTGKAMRFDTDVERDEAVARWHLLRELGEDEPAPPAAPKKPTREPKYGTIGGHEGAYFYSDYVEVESNRLYTLRIDYRADPANEKPTRRYVPKVFVKGYRLAEVEVAGEDGKPEKVELHRSIYEIYKNLEDPSTEWKTYVLEFDPTARTPEVKWIRVMLFPYWPPGVYWFDRVQVILGAGVAPASNPDRLETEYRAARDQIRLFVAALERYRESAGSYPTTLQGLKALREKPQREPVPSNWQGPYLDDSIPLDPWGMRYRYFSPGSARPEAFDLSSTGPDRKAGGGDGVEYLGEGWKDE